MVKKTHLQSKHTHTKVGLLVWICLNEVETQNSLINHERELHSYWKTLPLAQTAPPTT